MEWNVKRPWKNTLGIKKKKKKFLRIVIFARNLNFRPNGWVKSRQQQIIFSGLPRMLGNGCRIKNSHKLKLPTHFTTKDKIFLNLMQDGHNSKSESLDFLLRFIYLVSVSFITCLFCENETWIFLFILTSTRENHAWKMWLMIHSLICDSCDLWKPIKCPGLNNQQVVRLNYYLRSASVEFTENYQKM